jgi:folate-binding protein YgfZ
MYKLRSKVHVNEVNNLYSYSVFGDLKKDQDTFIFNIDPRNVNIGIKLIHLKKNPEILNSLNEINEEKYHQILIQNIVPLSHYDLEENKSLLLENNFENLNSISWDKGCYVGQEITARMKYRALLKKKIYSLEIKDGSPIIGQQIKDDENEYGKIINIKNDSVLAMLKIELAEKKINTKQQIKTNEGVVLEFIL